MSLVWLESGELGARFRDEEVGTQENMAMPHNDIIIGGITLGSRPWSLVSW